MITKVTTTTTTTTTKTIIRSKLAENGAARLNGQSSSNHNEDNHRPLRIMIITESFHPYTSGIARRFKEILSRLAKRGFLIHILTGCKVSHAFTNLEIIYL